MQSPISPKMPLSAPPRWSRWGSLLLLLALAAALFVWSKREEAPAGKDTPTGREKTGSGYENRSLWRGPPPSPGAHAVVSGETISGTVYDSDGERIVGARVVAKSFQIAGNIATTASSAESDEHGRFELRLLEGSYYLNAVKEGYGPSLIQAHSGDTVSLVLPKSGVIEGHVYDERRAPVRHFTIDLLTVTPESVAAAPPLWSKTFDSPDGSFRLTELPGSRVIVRATAPDKAPAFAPPTVVAATQTRQIDMVLTDGCTLAGAVEDKKGNPIPDVFVDAETRIGAGSMMESSVAAPSQAKSDMQGHFLLERVAVGQVLIRGYDGANAVTTVNVELSSCDKTEPVKLVMSDGGSIAGVVRGDDGTPIPGVRLTVTQKAIGFVNTLSDAEGRFRFDQIPPSVVRLEAQRDGRRLMQLVTVKDEAVTQQDITLLGHGQGEIRGHVTARGKPLAGAQLMIGASYPEKGLGTFSPVTAEDGSYRLPGIPEGGYIVVVSSTLRGATVQVKPGDVATVDLDIVEQPVLADRGERKGSRE